MSGAGDASERAGMDQRLAEREGYHEVTFLGRGRAVRSGTRFVLLVCPLCSQRNGSTGAERGICEWCAYQPSPRDIEPVTGRAA